MAGLPCPEGSTAHVPPPVLIDAEPARDTTPDSLFSRERQATLLSALAGTGNVRSARRAGRVSHQTAYRTRLASPGFRRAGVVLLPVHGL